MSNKNVQEVTITFELSHDPFRQDTKLTCGSLHINEFETKKINNVPLI